MLGSVSPVVVAAREAVQDIAELYDGYHGDLVRELVIALQILDSQPSQLAQRRSTEDLIKRFAAEVTLKLGD